MTVCKQLPKFSKLNAGIFKFKLFLPFTHVGYMKNSPNCTKCTICHRRLLDFFPYQTKACFCKRIQRQIGEIAAEGLEGFLELAST